MNRMRFIPWILFVIAAWLGLGGCGSGYHEAAAKSDVPYRRGAGYPVAGVMADSGGGEDAPAETTTVSREETIDFDSDASPAPQMPGNVYAAKQAPAAPPAPDAKPVAPSTGVKPPQGPSTSDKRQPILIYTASFTLSVYEVKKSLDALEGLAKSVGGFVARRDDRSITLRVPAADFAGAVIELEKLGDVLNRNVVAEDVTAEYRDLEVQLQNLVALRARFEKLLEKAQKVEEALQIERELGRITGEIERIKGRIKVLNDQAQYSTITVVFQPRSSQQIQDGPFILPLPWLNGLGLPRLLAL